MEPGYGLERPEGPRPGSAAVSGRVRRPGRHRAPYDCGQRPAVAPGAVGPQPYPVHAAAHSRARCSGSAAGPTAVKRVDLLAGAPVP